MRFGLWLLAWSGVLLTSSASAQIDSVIVVVATRVPDISGDTIREGLRAEGLDVRTPDQAGDCTDTVVVLIDRDGRRATVFTRTPTGVDVQVLHARQNVRRGAWLAQPLARIVLESRANWRPRDLHNPWHRALRGDFIARVNDGIVDPWAMMIVAGRIDTPAIADPWAND